MKYPGFAGEPTDDPDDMSHMVRISSLIKTMQETLDRFGDTCVYIRRGGLSWGAVALNRESDDKRFGIFDLQETHDRAMAERVAQCERLIETARNEREQRWKAEAALKSKDEAMGVLFERMKAAGIDYSDLIP